MFAQNLKGGRVKVVTGIGLDALEQVHAKIQNLLPVEEGGSFRPLAPSPSLALKQNAPGPADWVVSVGLLTSRFSEVSCLNSLHPKRKRARRWICSLLEGSCHRIGFQPLSLVCSPWEWT